MAVLMPKPQPDFAMSDLLAQLQQSLVSTEEGYTVRELVKATGASQHQVRNQLRAWFEAGRLQSVRKRVQAMDGRMQLVPAYRLKVDDGD